MRVAERVQASWEDVVAICADEAGVAANTIHDGLGYRLTLRAPADQAAELEPLMAEFVARFTFPD